MRVKAALDSGLQNWCMTMQKSAVLLSLKMSQVFFPPLLFQASPYEKSTSHSRFGTSFLPFIWPDWDILIPFSDNKAIWKGGGTLELSEQGLQKFPWKAVPRARSKHAGRVKGLPTDSVIILIGKRSDGQ